MTTIAYKDGVIAYESRICNASAIIYDDFDKCQELKGVKFVLTGYVCDYSKLIGAWFGEPVTGTVECSALVFDGESLCYAAYSSNYGHPDAGALRLSAWQGCSRRLWRTG